jgi:hypothetical protein
MKKYISWLLLPLFFLLSLFTTKPIPATAQSVSPTAGIYACILGDNTYFYTAANDQSGLFLLPKTYFVKTLEVANDFCKIEYLYDDEHVSRIVGYAKTEELTFVDFIPERPYLYYLFELSYTLENTSSNSNDNFLTQITFTCAYYGDYKIGSKTYCYVLREGKFGYVPKPETISFDENPEYTQSLTPDAIPETSEPQQEQTSPDGVQIAILVALCLLVPVLAALIIKPPRRPPYETDE